MPLHKISSEVAQKEPRSGGRMQPKGASPGSYVGQERGPKGRKKSYDTNTAGTAEKLHPDSLPNQPERRHKQIHTLHDRNTNQHSLSYPGAGESSSKTFALRGAAPGR